jgi:hypothetical protein
VLHIQNNLLLYIFISYMNIISFKNLKCSFLATWHQNLILFIDKDVFYQLSRDGNDGFPTKTSKNMITIINLLENQKINNIPLKS